MAKKSSNGNKPVILDSHGRPMRKHASMTGFDAASIGRRTANWQTTSAGINSLLSGSLAVMRDRARDQVRNIPWVKRASRSYVANIIGTGIRPISKTPDQDFNREISQVWDDWGLEADADGILDFYGLQTLAATSFRNAGEVLIQKIYRPTDRYDLVIPYQIRLLEPDHLDHLYSTYLDNGGKIVQGIEFDSNGDRVAYHLWQEHPQETMSGFGAAKRIRVPAAEIIHIYEPSRPGQVRGYPGIASSILRMLDMMEYEDAELVRKKLAAMLVGFITSPADEDGNVMGEVTEDGEDVPVAQLETGTMQKLDPGQEVIFNQPADVGGSYESFMKMNLRASAAGADVTYESMTGDYSGVNFSSLRAALNEIQRIWQQTQNNIFVHQMCRPIRRDVVTWAVRTGIVRMPEGFSENPRPWLRAKWVAPGWPYVNPQQEAQAIGIDMRNGLVSRAAAVAAKGRDISELDEEIAEDNKRADGLGLRFDSDPRKSAAGGQPLANIDPDMDQEKQE